MIYRQAETKLSLLDFRRSKNIPIKDYGLDPYFRSVAALLDAPPPLPVNLVLVGALHGDPENSGNFRIILQKS